MKVQGGARRPKPQRPVDSEPKLVTCLNRREHSGAAPGRGSEAQDLGTGGLLGGQCVLFAVPFLCYECHIVFGFQGT